MVKSHGIPLKKQFGQHFLRDQKVVEHMLEHVTLTTKVMFLKLDVVMDF